jgi:hypothetical protein
VDNAHGDVFFGVRKVEYTQPRHKGLVVGLKNGRKELSQDKYHVLDIESRVVLFGDDARGSFAVDADEEIFDYEQDGRVL